MLTSLALANTRRFTVVVALQQLYWQMVHNVHNRRSQRSNLKSMEWAVSPKSYGDAFRLCCPAPLVAQGTIKWYIYMPFGMQLTQAGLDPYLTSSELKAKAK